MIGLKRGTVALSPYRKGWAKEFEKEKQRIQKTLGDFAIGIEHIGSTSIPGLSAKPLIDIELGIERLKDSNKLVKKLEKIGYKFNRKIGREHFFAKGSDAKRTHYLHVVRYNGEKWKKDVAFRDYLISHPKRKKAYGDLKKKLSKQFKDERYKYTDAKAEFIQKTLKMAGIK